MDLTSPAVIKQLRTQFDFQFKKGLGQNFLTSREVLEKIAQAADASEGILEIGPGFGVLTAELAAHTQKVVSIEIDQRLFPVLHYTLTDYDNIELIQGDVMKLDLAALIREKFSGGTVSVAANLPYYITTPVITRLIESRLPLKNIVVMIQKEVAQRLCASPGSKEYGAISVLCQYYTRPKIICNVGAGLFIPPPKVDSAVLKMELRDTPAVTVENETLYFKTVRAAFSQRRKTLLNCLSSAFPISKPELQKRMLCAGIEPTRRGETLSLEEFAALSHVLR